MTCTTGAVSWQSVPSGQGDLVLSDSQLTDTDRSHMIELVGLPETPLGVPHTCDAMGEITLTVSDGDATSLTNSTSCQIPVGRITIQLEQNGELLQEETMPQKTLNFSGAFYVESGVDVTFKVTIDRGGPVLLEYDFDEGQTGVTGRTEDIQRAVTASDQFTQTVQFASSGTFTVRVKGSNKHSLPEHQALSEVTVTVQHPVTTDWLPVFGAASSFLTVVTGVPEPAQVAFEMRLPSTSQLPTDAHMEIDFGDQYQPLTRKLSDNPIK